MPLLRPSLSNRWLPTSLPSSTTLHPVWLLSSTVSSECFLVEPICSSASWLDDER